MDSLVATVRPRVILPETGDAVPLDDLAAEWLASEEPRCLEIVGGPGFGKSTALAWLARTLSGPHDLVDNVPDCDFELTLRWATRPVICASERGHPQRSRVRSFALAGWGLDEWIEYLRSAHPARLCDVVARLREVPRGEIGALRGSPQLWRLVLDEFAADPNLGSIRGSLDAALERVRQPLQAWLAAECQDTAALFLPGAFHRLPPALALLRHPIMQTVCLARKVVEDLRLRPLAAREYLVRPLSNEQIREIGTHAATKPDCHAHLCRLADWFASGCQPMAASILHAGHIAWRPPDPRPTDQLNLCGARLAGCDWPGAALQGAILAVTQFDRANLSGANLENVEAYRISLRHARLGEASLLGGNFVEGDFFGADLSETDAPLARFDDAHLACANLSAARLVRASFAGAELRETSFQGADLTGAKFAGAKIEDTDFTGALLLGAQMQNLDLRSAVLTGASLRNAFLHQSNLIGQELPQVDLEGADLTRADLSGVDWPGARLAGADLRGAGLADVEWEGADLRNADLRLASFHAGSSRSGLVNSPFACEGSRMGFYTDEFCEQDFQPPEQIRKANLCGADLRGACIENVDFYLVDLRRAKYTPHQAEHLRRTGAILVERARAE